MIKNVSRHCQAELPPRWDPLGYCLVENGLFLRKKYFSKLFFLLQQQGEGRERPHSGRCSSQGSCSSKKYTWYSRGEAGQTRDGSERAGSEAGPGLSLHHSSCGVPTRFCFSILSYFLVLAFSLPTFPHIASAFSIFCRVQSTCPGPSGSSFQINTNFWSFPYFWHPQQRHLVDLIQLFSPGPSSLTSWWTGSTWVRCCPWSN